MTLKLIDVETFDRTEQSSTLHCTRQTWNTNLDYRRLRTECTQRQERGLRRRERRSWTHSTTGLERNWRENCNRTIRQPICLEDTPRLAQHSSLAERRERTLFRFCHV